MDGDVISVLRDDSTWGGATVKRDENEISYSGFGEECVIEIINPSVSFIRDNGYMVEVSKGSSKAYVRHQRRKQQQNERRRAGRRSLLSR